MFTMMIYWPKSLDSLVEYNVVCVRPYSKLIRDLDPHPKELLSVVTPESPL